MGFDPISLGIEGAALFGGLDALGLGAAEAGVVGAGALGAADVAGAGAVGAGLGAADLIGAGTAGTIVADAAVGGELGALGLAGEAGVPGAVATDAFAGLGGGIPFAEATPVATETLGGAGTVGAGGAGAIPGSAAIPGFPSASGFGGAAVTGATDLASATAPLGYSPAVTGAADIATLPGVSPAAGGALPEALGAGNLSTIASAPGATTASLPGAGGGFLDSLGKAITANPLQTAGVAAAGGSLLYNMFTGNQLGANEKSTLAGLQAQTAGLWKNFQSGNIPAGFKVAIQQATKAADAAAISAAASHGLPTNPTQNSELAAALAQNQVNAIIATAQVSQQILTGGMSAIGLQENLAMNLFNIDKTQATLTGNALANFSAALAGGRGTNLRTPAPATV